jgi:hypothetical protein
MLFTPPQRPDGILQIHRSRLIRMTTGERFPIVVRADGTLVAQACGFIGLQRRRALSVKRLSEMAHTIASIHDYFHHHDIDLDSRAETGSTLAPNEVLDLCQFLQGVAPRTHAIRVAAAADGDMPLLHVGGVEWQNRLFVAARYIAAWLNRAVYALRTDAVAHHILVGQIARIAAQFKETNFKAKSQPREGLTIEQYRFFEGVVHPASRLNPWPPEDRLMVFIICMLNRLFGLRAREPLLLQVVDLFIKEGRPALRVDYADPAADNRGAPAYLKRGPRTLYVPEWFGRVVADYIAVDRPKIGARLRAAGNHEAARRFDGCPFLFVSSRGTELSSSGMYKKIYHKLRETFPDELPADLAPGRLRNSKADELMRAGREEAVDVSRVAEHLMGWVVGSPMLDRYANAQAERDAGDWIERRSRQLEGEPA